jgi:hypothetical protein
VLRSISWKATIPPGRSQPRARRSSAAGPGVLQDPAADDRVEVAVQFQRQGIAGEEAHGRPPGGLDSGPARVEDRGVGVHPTTCPW